MSFEPKRLNSCFSRHSCYHLRTLLNIRALCLSVALVGLLYWFAAYESSNADSGAFKTTRGDLAILGSDLTGNLQFFPASNPKIHYVGRWTATPNRLRRDGTFPGVYFDITVNATKSLFLSLHNSDVQRHHAKTASGAAPSSSSLPQPGHLSFHSNSLVNSHASPVSLIARIDREDYILLPNSSTLVTVSAGGLDLHRQHNIRIIAPMMDGEGSGVVQVEGLWLEKGGRLLRVEGSQLGEEVEDEDTLTAENSNIGRKHRGSWVRLSPGSFSLSHGTKADSEGGKEAEDDRRVSGRRKRVLEVITDSPASLGCLDNPLVKHSQSDLLRGVMGWDYLLGDMFGIDHATVAVDGMCLIQNCIGGVGGPAGIGDAFFRSGPPGSAYFEHPWLFHAYIPDIMIFNLGSSDFTSYQDHGQEYNETNWELYERFEDSYVSLVKAIRQLAYPEHPDLMGASGSAAASHASTTGIPTSAIPIFVMRPLRGQFEHATQSAVNRLRAEGDRAVFWLDTSGWLDVGESGPTKDFMLDTAVVPARWRLTEYGNQRVAMFLHLHVCRYLAADGEQCAFLPPETYEGKMFSPDTLELDWQLERAKERKLKQAFWRED